MGDLKASPLHMISAIINAPRFHREIEECPPEITERCVHLLTALGRSREIAIQTNYEVMEFLTHTVSPFDDAGYMRVSRYFVQELLTVVGPQHKLWGAISYVMLSATPHLPEGDQLKLWKRINARFFEVLLDSRVISNEEEKRLKVKSVHGEVGPQPDLDLDEPQPDPPSPSKDSSVHPPDPDRSREQSQEQISRTRDQSQRGHVHRPSTTAKHGQELPKASSGPSEVVKLLGGVAISSNSSTALSASTSSKSQYTGPTTSTQSTLEDTTLSSSQQSPKDLPHDLKTLLSATPRSEIRDKVQDPEYSPSLDTQASKDKDEQSSALAHQTSLEMKEVLSTPSSEVTFKVKQRRPTSEVPLATREGSPDRIDLKGHDKGHDRMTEVNPLDHPSTQDHHVDQSTNQSDERDEGGINYKSDGQTTDNASMSDQTTTIVGRTVKKANVRSIFGRRS